VTIQQRGSNGGLRNNNPDWQGASCLSGFAVAAGSSPRSQYLQKRRQQFKIGSRGSEPGCFTWPRGIAVGPDNSIVVADSSNHRVQVFDANGIFVKEFGSYGNAEGEFDCLAGVAVNRIGQFIIADRYNHRIQVMKKLCPFYGPSNLVYQLWIVSLCEGTSKCRSRKSDPYTGLNRPLRIQ